MSETPIARSSTVAETQHADQIRQDILERAGPLPDTVRQELFGQPDLVIGPFRIGRLAIGPFRFTRREIGPSLVVETAEHASVRRPFPGLGLSVEQKAMLADAAEQVRLDPDGAAADYKSMVERHRGHTE